MNLLKTLLIALVFFGSRIGFAQAEPDYAAIIKGVWVTTQSLVTSEIEAPLVSSYSRYEFSDDGTLYFATNDFERGERMTYKVIGDKVQMLGYTYDIKSYVNDELEIETTLLITPVVRSATLVRKEKFDRLWKLRDHDDKAVKTTAIFEGNLHLYDYVFSRYSSPDEFARYYIFQLYQPPPVPPRLDVFIRIDIVVDSTGNVEVKNISGSPEIKGKALARMRKKIENTSGYWAPASNNGHKETQTLTMTFVKRGKKSLEIKDRAIRHFHLAYQYYHNEDYFGAIQKCTDAITLDQSKFQFYLLRAVCNIKLAELDKYCHDVGKANALNPFVSLLNIEIVKGETLEIRCGRE